MMNHWSIIFLLYSTSITNSFVVPNTNFIKNVKTYDRLSTTNLKYKNTEYNDSNINSSIDKRFEVRGVSVSPVGFLVLLSVNDLSSKNIESVRMKRKQENNDNRATICIRVSNDKADEMHCSSPEALTIVQLLSGVDMAGAVLPPQLLQHLVALHCSVFEDVIDDDAYVLMRKAISQVLKDTPYLEATQWQLNQIRYPKVVLKGLKLSLPSDHDDESLLKSLQEWNFVDKRSVASSPLPMKFQLDCTVDGFPISIPLL